jgi:hypothetical protein
LRLGNAENGAWFARQAAGRRWIFANLAATAVGLAFGLLDMSHPRSPPDAYGIAVAQCVLFVIVVSLFGWARARNIKALDP